jgi:hypothetical protein
VNVDAYEIALLDVVCVTKAFKRHHKVHSLDGDLVSKAASFPICSCQYIGIVLAQILFGCADSDLQTMQGEKR